MNRILLKRIGISTFMTLLLCLTAPLVLFINNEEVKMTVFEWIFKYDWDFYIKNMITVFSPATGGLSNLWLSVLLPFTCSLPGLFGFADTMRGYWRLEYIRKSKCHYRIRKFSMVCFSGAIGTSLGYLIYVLMLLPIFPYDVPTTTRLESGELFTFPPPPIMDFISSVASRFIILFFISFLTSAICICVYLLTENRYKAVGMLIVIYYLLYETSAAFSFENP